MQYLPERSRVCWLILTMLYCSFLQLESRADLIVIDGDGEVEPTFTYRMSITPAGVDVPVLKHRLQSKRIDLKPGNAAPYYYRSLLGMEEIRRQLERSFGDSDILSEWSALATKDLPRAKLREALGLFRGQVSDNLLVGTQKRECDWQWQYEDIRGQEALNFQLPEIQASRDVLRILSLLTRLDIAEQRYDSAIAAIRMSLRLSHDVAKEPLLVCGLVGIAGYGSVNDSLIEFISAPESPNLYWPLSALPSPPIPMIEHARGDLELGLRMFPMLEKANAADWTDEEWNEQFRKAAQQLVALADDTSSLTGDATDSNRDALFTKFIGPSLGAIGYRHAKKRLSDLGYDEISLEEMPVGQVLSIYSAHAFQRCADEFESTWCVPYWESREMDADFIVERAHMFGPFEDREILPIASLLLPAIQAARVAEMRITRDIAALRVIEALRMHMAETGEELPVTLDIIDCVHVPDNPATGKPFSYRLEGETAIIELPSEDGLVVSRRFVISMARGGE